MAYNKLIDYSVKNIVSKGSTYVDIGFDHGAALADAQSIVSNIGDRRYVLDNMAKVSRLADTVDLIKAGGFEAVSVDLDGAMSAAKSQMATFAVGEVRNFVENSSTIQDAMGSYTDVMKAVNMTQNLRSLVSDGDMNGVLSIGKDMVLNAAMVKMEAFSQNEDVAAVKEGATDVLKAVSEMQTISGYRDILGSAIFTKFAPARAKAAITTIRNIRENMNKIQNIVGGLDDITSFEDAFSDMDGLLNSVDGVAGLLGGQEIVDNVRSSMETTKTNVDKAVTKMKAAKSVFDSAKSIGGGLFG